MYGGYGSSQSQSGSSSSQAPTYNYDSIFGTTDNSAYNQQYQQYLNALSQYTQQTTPANVASVAAGYGSSMLDSYAGNYTNNSGNIGTASSEATAQYTSFEQAMMQQARINQQNSNRAPAGFSNFKTPFGKRNYAGKGMQVGNFQKRKGPPKPPVDPKKYYCDTCNISCANPQAFQDHMQGKSHKRKEELSKGTLQPLAKNKSSFKCEVCNVTCTGKESFDTHINGVKHAKAIKNLQLLGKPVPENISTIIPPSNPNLILMKKAINPDGSLNGDSQSTILDSCEESLPPIGEEFIEAIEGGGKQTQYKCKLCDCTCGDATAKKLHVSGRRHRLAYKQKVDFSIHVDAKPNGRNIKARKQMRENLKVTTFPVAWVVAPANGPPTIPDTTSYDLFDEQHLCAKLDQLRPEPKIIEQTDALIGVVEKSLKKTSDALNVKLAPSGESNATDNDNRVLRGVIRTGVLGDRLLTKTDRQIHAVLLCRDIPTVSLLQSITSQFIENIEDEKLRQKTILESSVEDSGFSVKFNDGEVVCFITMTSIALAELNNEAVETSATKAKIEKPKDALPLEPMNAALCAMRQTKFFQQACWPIQGLCEVVVVLRDLFLKIPVWNILSLHAIELLVYKTIITSPVMPRISDTFRRFFEVISSGQFMSSTNKLIDPCEKNDDKNDMFANFTRQQRENMMFSGQNILRLIAYDQIYTVLGIDRLPISNRKRPNESDDDENGIKKEKMEDLTHDG